MSVDSANPAPTNIHTLKVRPRFFEEIAEGLTEWELQVGTHEYAIGDLLRLREWLPEEGEYTGEEMLVRVTHVTALSDTQHQGLVIRIEDASRH